MNKTALRNKIKATLLLIPKPILRQVVKLRDWYWWLFCKIWEARQPYKKTIYSIPAKQKKRVLIYAIHGMRHAGTEKNLQLVANSLTDDYEVFFMYGIEPASKSRSAVLDSQITHIPFTYSSVEIPVPNRIFDMQPRLASVVKDYQIDCLITASPGYSHYPWNQVRDIPIVLLNIFGAPTLQPNVHTVIYNSMTTKKHAGAWIGEDARAIVQFAPLLTTPPKTTRDLGAKLREKLGISPSDFVFGRIGRADDGIFDPIGIRAWQMIAEKYPSAHYLIMSPPPALTKIVQKENIPRVHLLPPSNIEEEVWAFHGALDAMAHFRFDGETSGVAIAESLAVGNPIISHYSHIWNAHAEYLDISIARFAQRDNHQEYAAYMEELINVRDTNTLTWKAMQKQATMVAEKNFSPDTYKKMTKSIIDLIIQ